MRLHLCQLELARRRLGRGRAAPRRVGSVRAGAAAAGRCTSAAGRCSPPGRGRRDEAERWAAETIERAEATRQPLGPARGAARARASRPCSRTSRRGPPRACAPSGSTRSAKAWRSRASSRWRRISSRRSSSSASSTRRARSPRGSATLAEEQEHPWAPAAAKRCDALVRLDADLRREAGALARGGGARRTASSGCASIARGRCSRSAAAQRRAEEVGRARATALEQAAAAFEAIGSPGWADEARSELSRVGARGAAPPAS